MSARSYAVRDSITMLRRDVTHSLRFPMMSVSGILTPIVMPLLFAGVFGRTLRSGLGGFGGAGGGGYIDFLTPVIDTFRGLMTGGPVGRHGPSPSPGASGSPWPDTSGHGRSTTAGRPTGPEPGSSHRAGVSGRPGSRGWRGRGVRRG